MQHQTPQTLSLDIAPRPEHTQNKASAPAPSTSARNEAACPFASVAPPGATCPVSGASASSSSAPPQPQQQEPKPEAEAEGRAETRATTSATSACPFASLVPAARAGAPPPRCPRWVRVLRFAAKLVAKQVAMRAAKSAVRGLLKRLGDKPCALTGGSSEFGGDAAEWKADAHESDTLDTLAYSSSSASWTSDVALAPRD